MALPEDSEFYIQVRNKLRQFNRESMLFNFIDILHSIEKGEQKSILYQQGWCPWTFLLAIKWLMADWKNINATKEPTYNDIIFIINTINRYHPTQDEVLYPNTSNKIVKILRRRAFQQAWLQESIDEFAVGRSVELFLNLPCNFNLDNFCMGLVGIGFEKYFYLLFIFWRKSFEVSQSSEENSGIYLTDLFFQSLKSKYSKKDVETALNFVGLDFEQASVYCKKHMEKDKDIDGQIFEQSPFKYKPFLKTPMGYLAYSPKLIENYLINGFYDLCKKERGGSFCTEFGETFESYIKKSLDYNDFKYITETEMKGYKFSKQVDFLLRASEGNILIEVKSTEARPIVKKNPLDKIMSSAYETSIVRGIIQGITVSDIICNKKIEPFYGKINYLLIVTYKELYLGSSASLCAWEEFIKETIEDKFSSVPIDAIDPSRIFFLSVDAFDRFLILCKGNTDLMIEKLEEIIEKNEGHSTKRFTFSQHLEDEDIDTEKHFLVNNFDYIFNETGVWR